MYRPYCPYNSAITLKSHISIYLTVLLEAHCANYRALMHIAALTLFSVPAFCVMGEKAVVRVFLTVCSVGNLRTD